jgi:hypothetical protein
MVCDDVDNFRCIILVERIGTKSYYMIVADYSAYF